MKLMAVRNVLSVTLGLSALSCALGVSFDSYSVDPDPQQVRLYRVSGTVEGLEGLERLTLRLNGAVLPFVGNGPFAFQPSVADGVPWRLVSFGEACAITPSTGIIAARDATGIAIRCGAADTTSSDTTLGDLSFSDTCGNCAGVFSAAPLNPMFTPSTLDYSLSPSDGTGSFADPGPLLMVKAVAAHRGASVTIAGRAVGMGGSAAVQLDPAKNHVDVVVTAADRSTAGRYRVVAQIRPPGIGP